MNLRLTGLPFSLAILPSLGHAQYSLAFDQAAYITCRQAQGMAPDARSAVAAACTPMRTF